MERAPYPIENTLDRFVDYIGNSLAGIKGMIQWKDDEINPDRGSAINDEKVRSFWNSLFERVAILLKEPEFRSSGNITKENLQKLLALKSENPLDPEALRKVEELYRFITQ